MEPQVAQDQYLKLLRSFPPNKIEHTCMYDFCKTFTSWCPVFQITFKGRVPTGNFDGSIDVAMGLPISFPIYFVGSGGQLSWVFDLRPLSYLEHRASFMQYSATSI